MTENKEIGATATPQPAFVASDRAASRLAPTGFNQAQSPLEQAWADKEAAIAAAKEEFWREHEKLRARQLAKIEEAERAYRQAWWASNHRSAA